MRVKTETRRKAFVEAAGRLFIEQGFAAVSMEGVAAAAGSSKVTLYNYFASKEDLFEAFVVEAGAGAVEQLAEVFEDGKDAQTVLSDLGTALLRLVTRPDVIALDRLIMSEAVRQPQLARIFFENGPKRTTAALMDVITKCMRNGLISPGDARQAALHFKALCAGDMIEAQMWGLASRPGDSEIQAVVVAAVHAFLSGYGPKGT